MIDNDHICAICLETIKDKCIPTELECSHCYCYVCIYRWKNKNNNCPICRKKISHVSEYIDANEYYLTHIMLDRRAY